jgi:hypothetical protein
MSACGLNAPYGALIAIADQNPRVSIGFHRKIIHINMDGVLASVEQRDTGPTRQAGAVGGWAERGVVATRATKPGIWGSRSYALDHDEKAMSRPDLRQTTLRGLQGDHLASDHCKPNGQYVISPEMGHLLSKSFQSSNSTGSVLPQAKR